MTHLTQHQALLARLAALSARLQADAERAAERDAEQPSLAAVMARRGWRRNAVGDFVPARKAGR